MTFQRASSELRELKPVHLQVLKDLASGVSVTQAAAAVGVHRTTVHNWCRNHPQFASTLRDACFERMSRVQEEIETLTPSAISVLRNVLQDPQTPTSTRLRAALTVIRYATSFNIDTATVDPKEMFGAMFHHPAPTSVLPGSTATQSTPANEPASEPAPSKPAPSKPAGPTPQESSAESPTAQPVSAATMAPAGSTARTPRNQRCPCGSGLKFKKCCLMRQTTAGAHT
ncbi:MAG: SEC-C domain-containing protein [Bryobacterales bacterium]|nr:SEC-C domain-containing protein [Bryobacterales bacterium]